jgi:dipeptidyl aminopeptidase/acylaminoacyl peptidase
MPNESNKMSATASSKSEVTIQDIRKTKLWSEVDDFFTTVYAPSFGKISGASDLEVSPDGHTVAFTGATREKLEGNPNSRICLVDIEHSEIKTVTDGPNSSKLPKWSNDGKKLAFLSDRVEKGTNQLYIGELDKLNDAKPLSSLDTIAEYLHWSPDGKRILVGMAGKGAEAGALSGSGSVAKSKEAADEIPDWMPTVQAADDETQWRSIWVHDTKDGSIRQVSKAGTNVWEASWCGNDRAVAIVSENEFSEGAWQSAKLITIDVSTGDEKVIYESPRQMGLPTTSPSGQHVAFLQAVCSDRGLIAGDVLLLDANSSGSKPTVLDIGSTDASHIVWRDDDTLFYIGQRNLNTVAGDYNTQNKKFTEFWDTSETTGYFYPNAAPVLDGFVTVCSSWTRHPEIAEVRGGKYKTVAKLDNGTSESVKAKLGSIEQVKWEAPDGLEIQGLLHLPKHGSKPYPLVMNVHGGPVWAFRDSWLGGRDYVAVLNSQGYAVFHPNPRGSAGRGQAFAEKVYGDMGGADTHDYLSGLDMLVKNGIADPKRLGVTGGSYGGYITTWIITQTDRFAAAFAQAPVTDWVSQHTTSNIPHFDSTFLDGKPYAANGLYHSRSPIKFAGKHATPVMQTAGSVDRCTPPTQALQYHQALVEKGVRSVLVTYPGEGHGVRKFPAYIDLCTRMVGWFEMYMPTMQP